jgi:hypothetical protein
MVARPVYRMFIVDDHPAVRAGIKDQPGGSNDLRAAGERPLWPPTALRRPLRGICGHFASILWSRGGA